MWVPMARGGLRLTTRRDAYCPADGLPPLRRGGKRAEARVGCVEVRLLGARALGRREVGVGGEGEGRRCAADNVRRRHVEKLRGRAHG